FGEVGDLAAQREPRLDRVFQRLFVEHGKRPGKAEAHRADLGVSLRPKVGAAAAPDLGAGGKLDVDFEADDHFVHVTPPPAGAWAGLRPRRSPLRTPLRPGGAALRLKPVP